MDRRNFLKLSVTTIASTCLPLTLIDSIGAINSDTETIILKIKTSIGDMLYDMPYSKAMGKNVITFSQLKSLTIECDKNIIIKKIYSMVPIINEFCENRCTDLPVTMRPGDNITINFPESIISMS